jgi:hypothetical protein
MNIANNDLRASEGRETKALNCKPITNLKEKSELSNYCKPAVFVCTLLAVAILPSMYALCLVIALNPYTNY